MSDLSRLGMLRARLYAVALFDDFMPIYPLYLIMFTNSGLGAGQVASLLLVWSLTAFLLEVPSGSLADRFSRKYILIVAQFIRAIGYGFWLFMPDYTGFLIGFVLWGIESALSSGTKQALIYDELKGMGEESVYTKVVGHMQSLGIIAAMMASFLAAGLVPQGYEMLLVISIASCVVVAGVLATLPRARKVESTEEDKYFAHLKGGIMHVVRHPRVLRIILFSAFIMGVGAIDEFENVFFGEGGLDDVQISFWFGILGAAGVAGSMLAHRVSKAFTWCSVHVVAMVLVWGLALGAAAFIAQAYAMVAFITVFTFMFYLVDTMTDGWLQHSIESRSRATVTSVQGFLAEFFALLSIGFVGFVAEESSYVVAFQFVAVGIIAISSMYLLWLGVGRLRGVRRG